MYLVPYIPSAGWGESPPSLFGLNLVLISLGDTSPYQFTWKNTPLPLA